MAELHRDLFPGPLRSVDSLVSQWQHADLRQSLSYLSRERSESPLDGDSPPEDEMAFAHSHLDRTTMGGAYSVSFADLGMDELRGTRCVRWQVVGNTVEMAEVASAGPLLSRNGLRVPLPCPLRDRSFASFAARRVGSEVKFCALFCLSNQTMYKLDFSLPDTKSSLSRSFFSDWKGSFTRVPYCQELSPLTCCRISFDSIAFGISNGTAVVGKYQAGGEYTEHHLKDTTILKRLWSTMTLGYGMSSAPIVAMSSVSPPDPHSFPPLLLTLNSQFALRLWNIETLTWVHGDQVDPYQGAPLPPSELRCSLHTAATSSGFHVAVYVAQKGRSPFISLYEVRWLPFSMSCLYRKEINFGTLVDIQVMERDAGYIGNTIEILASFVRRTSEASSHIQSRNLEKLSETGTSFDLSELLENERYELYSLVVLPSGRSPPTWTKFPLPSSTDCVLFSPSATYSLSAFEDFLFSGLFDLRTLHDALCYFHSLHRLPPPPSQDHLWDNPTHTLLLRQYIIRSVQLVGEATAVARTRSPLTLPMRQFCECVQLLWEQRTAIIGTDSSSTLTIRE
jgi:hypothetical protein